MATISDVFNELQKANSNLQQINTNVANLLTATNGVGNAVKQVDNTLNAGFVNMSQGIQGVIALQNFADQMLVHNSQQNDTIICLLEHISKWICELLSESHIQTGLQTVLKENVVKLEELYESVNPDAALELKRLEELHKQILECCPPPEQPPFCRYEGCNIPKPLDKEPPHPKYEEFKPTHQG